MRRGLSLQRDSRAALHRRADLRPDRGGAGKSFEPKIVGFLCNWCSYTGADLAGTARMDVPDAVRVVRVMCSSRVDPAFIIKSLQEGADGVLIGGCHPGDCHYHKGNYYARRRVAMVRSLLGTFGLFARVTKEFTETIERLGPSPFRKTGSPA
jgi:F420-non-reducing hydrogenase iron-sulfur subunit